MAENIPVSRNGIRPADSVQRFRRLVTGVGPDGKSRFEDDAPGVHQHVIADLDTFVYTNLWRTETTPVDNSGAVDDGLAEPTGIAPPPNGSVFRVVEFPPDSRWDKRDGTAERMYHSTPSLDYAIVLNGEIYAVLDTEERLMSAGDVLIQRGTAHSWSNRSDKSCAVAFVLIGGTTQPPS
ncbi:cupin domain-containing protein [Nocardia sp. R7R-8]|uniref:cupin domain-containing protein n=1 Tax=Nocardia sp. R7R-8 TaxID=3459304 RepID=UPI00403DD911